MNQEFVKYDRFDGTNFVHWKDKMLFLLTNMKISYLLDPDLPAPTSQDIDQVKAKHNKQGSVICFTSKLSSKEIWKALEYKYNTEK
ncbi:hypothetical protein MANES_17G044701v8 [Manihot esculenta]|uniref:Uncharacterized protein n=1 Tax=Manihot esculenta TaxID=3983 RepID=A0ACB7G2J7_MANES|nr:hypothetical protein MANES_17G044701v8 [Manihot esculenta]